ncbi:unnamed protein product [Caenorhabditis auriculariae]|uniref:Ubiquinone biosynthesis O-methyltransferase, mitochondrial n=1 Tax=Caenorhabditis auriculariae TaxID=2777116 RepID=A0A8S1HT26_9PELO|nr:unnamed protein product [Caenorhabditis auriculariae]
MIKSFRFAALPARFHSSTSSSSNSSLISGSIDQKEVEKFGDLSHEWTDEKGAFKALHSLNRLRVPWILSNVKSKKEGETPKIVDIGSGGGVLSIPLARAGLKVVGIDATKEAVESAKRTLNSRPLQVSKVAENVKFEWTSVEEFSEREENKEHFDAVVASEILEHVADVPNFVRSVISLARPGGSIFFTTINKTWMSRFAAIWLAEDVLRIVPKGVHQWDKFVAPDQLARLCEGAGCTVRAIHGFTLNPLMNSWEWVRPTQVNYALLAVKHEAKEVEILEGEALKKEFEKNAPKYVVPIQKVDNKVVHVDNLPAV